MESVTTVAAKASPLQRSSLRDQVLAILKHRLVSGELIPGEIYSAQALASELGTSASPVREAMLLLVNAGLMETVPNRGFLVVTMSDEDRAAVFEMRMWLEVPAMARLATMPELLASQEGAYRNTAAELVRAAEQGDLLAYLENDRLFHMGLIEMLGNRRLTRAIRDLRDQTRLFGLEELRRKGRLVQPAREHAIILDALVAGDSVKVQRLMTSHISHVMSDWAGRPPKEKPDTD